MRNRFLSVGLAIFFVTPLGHATPSAIVESHNDLSVQSTPLENDAKKHENLIRKAGNSIPEKCVPTNSLSEISDAAKAMRQLFNMRASGIISSTEFEKHKHLIIFGCSGGVTPLRSAVQAGINLDGGVKGNSYPISFKATRHSDLFNSDGSKFYPGYSWSPHTSGNDVSKTAAPVSAGNSDGCGSKGGPGFRLPNGRCASWSDVR